MATCDQSSFRESYCSTMSFAVTPQSAAIYESAAGKVRIEVVQGCRDFDENKSRSFLDTFEIEGSDLVKVSAHSVDIQKPVISSISPSNRRKVTVKSIEKKHIIEISANDVKFSARIEASSIHGAPIGDTWFGGCSWSSDESYFAFVAKCKDPETVSLIGLDAVKNDKISSSEAPKLVSAFEFVDDWGEKYENTSALVIVIVSVLDGLVSIVPGIDTSVFSVGQPVFILNPDKKVVKLAYTAWNVQDRKLGMIYCFHRKCSIFTTDITNLFQIEAPEKEVKEVREESAEGGSLVASSSNSTQVTTTAASPPQVHTCMTDSLYLARSPRSDESGKNIVFVGRKAELHTHNGCMELYLYSFETSSLRCILDSVTLQADASSFPGLFCDQLPRNCFLKDGRIIFNTSFASKESILVVDPSTSKLEILSGKFGSRIQSINSKTSGDEILDTSWNDNRVASYSIVEIKNNWILVNFSSPNSPSALILYNYNSDVLYLPVALNTFMPVCSFPSTKFASQSSSRLTEQAISGVLWKTFRYEIDSIPIESILMLPQYSSDGWKQGLPLIVVPHGGPHSSFSASFLGPYSFLCTQLSAGVLLVNYRGSTGFGQAGIDKLVGQIGKVDVDDCVFCVNKCLELTWSDIFSSDSSSGGGVAGGQQKIINPDKLAVCGGSHGGFLAGHLIGQFPGMFRAACMRNPVTNIPSMTTTSDIPDWCWIEATGEYNFKRFVAPSPEIIIKMYQASPIRYVESVKTPTLICLGAKDKRVPPSQGIEYYHLLKGQGTKAKLLIFPEDCHAIDKPKTEAEHWLAIASWLYSNFN